MKTQGASAEESCRHRLDLEEKPCVLKVAVDQGYPRDMLSRPQMLGMMFALLGFEALL